MLDLLRAAALAVAGSAAVARAASQITCGDGSNCPSSAPCCSQYGVCGVGAYCLGGCDPRYSFDLQSCMAAPVCKSQDYTMNSLDMVSPNTEYLGDPSKANWVSSGNPVVYQDEAILLTMPADSVGTLLTSTQYVWYGKVTATMTTSQGAGVVTAFILMSDVKDEIDFEFVGTDVQTAQSNYYFQGIPDYDNELNMSASNTESTMHTYTIDWQPDSLTWSVDGKVLRTKNRNETYNSTTGQYHYPQSPSRIQLSLWPAGASSNAQGTIDWAGGAIDWNSPYMQNGYYYAMVKDITVECYDPPSGYQNHGSKAYYYTTTAGTNDTVAMGNNGTTLASFYATGDNPDYDPSKASGTASASGAAATAETVPGVSGSGARGDSGSDGDSTSSASSSSSTGSSDSSSSSSSGSSSNSFSQGSTGDSSDGVRVVAGSLGALVAFFAAAMLL